MKEIQHTERSAMRRRPVTAAKSPLLGVLACMAVALPMIGHTAGHEMSGLEKVEQELKKQREMLQQQMLRVEELERQTQQKMKELEQKAELRAATVTEKGKAGEPDKEPLVTIYGLLDGGVEHLNNIGEGEESSTRLVSLTGTFPSRLGFKTAKPFGNGYKGVATLEAGFNFDEGTQGQGGRIFGRQLFAGIQTPSWGTFTIGRQYSALLYAMIGVDQLGPNIYGISSFDFYYPNMRYDNSLSWGGKFSNVSLRFGYSFGRDVLASVPGSGTCAGEASNVDDTTECQALSAMIRYDTKQFGVTFGVDELRGGEGATAFFFNGTAPIDFSDDDDTDRRFAFGAYYKLGKAKLSTGWFGRRVDTDEASVDSDMYYVQGSYKLGKFTFDGGIIRMVNDDQDRDGTLGVVRAFYNLTKGLDLYAQVGHMNNSSQARYQLSLGGGATPPPAGENQTGVFSGLRYRF